MKLNRHVWEEGSIHRSICGDEYDRVCDIAEQLDSSLAEAREEIERLKTYATMLEGNDYYSLKLLEIRDALGVSEAMMRWLIPDKHRGTIEALVDEQPELTRIMHYGRADWNSVKCPTKPT